MESYMRCMKMVNGFSVLTFNTLADGYAAQEDFPYVELIPFKQRITTIIKMIKQYNSSIVCLQEIDHAQKYTEALEKMGYLTYFNAVVSKTRKGTNHGIMLAVKFSEFIVKEYDHKFFPNNTHQFWALHLQEIKNKKAQLLFIGTHLKSKQENQEIRITQAKALVEYLTEQENKHKGIPMILAGDLNAEPKDPSINILMDCPIQPKLQSVYEREEWTTNKIRDKHIIRTIDYILYRGVNVVAYEQPPALEDINKKGLPDKMNPSDHIPLYALFTF